ncbi:unnamed protein product, partial [Rotaria sordida]
MMAIEMAGGVYCPLSPGDPQHRLHVLIKEAQSCLVLVHYLTETKFNDDIISLNIDTVLVDSEDETDVNFDRISKVLATECSIAYIILTSGSTGTPKASKKRKALQYLRSLCSIGEPFAVKLLDLIKTSTIPQCRIWNLYGQTETTIAATFHLVHIAADKKRIEIGVPLPNYHCIVQDEFLQSVVLGQEGYLLVGGVGVFLGYLGRNDLTSKSLVDIDGEMFYRTGDRARLDKNGFLHYQGRKDHQIKFHGQRIELVEIQQCLLDTSISACVVIKWNDDHLIAYVQSSDINAKQLRQHCQSHLPPHMIPSIFIILEKLPLNVNGKIDRKLLPPPSSYFFHPLQLNYTNNLQLIKPHDEIQIILHIVWCNMFQQQQISIDTNIFTIGGHSLILMQLYHRYQTTFHLGIKSLSITDLFQFPTIIGHAQFIRQAINIEKHFEDCWSPLHLIQAPASFAQERIFLDEKIRFSSKSNNKIYAIPLVFRVLSANTPISITRLHRAFQFVIMKHSILRTALDFSTNGIIIQHSLNVDNMIDDMKPYGFSIIDLHDDKDRGIIKPITEIINHRDLFDLTKGCVIQCHILRQYQLDDNLSFKNDNLLTKDDLILFNIHHSAFDGASISVFLHDFSLAYETDCSLPLDDDAMQYIDYSVYERQANMTLSRDFWRSHLQGHNLEHRLSLPTDQQRTSADQRSGLASIAQISFDDDISTTFLNYANVHKVTPFQLGLATFYTFLFKLTHGLSDLCIACFNANRYKNELENMIGMFVATLPYCIHLNSHWSFDELVKHVRDMCWSILKHSHYPLQYILADSHLNQLNVPFLETTFDFITVSSDMDHISLDGATLEQVSLDSSCEVAKFDFMLTFVYNPTLNDDRLSCRL